MTRSLRVRFCFVFILGTVLLIACMPIDTYPPHIRPQAGVKPDPSRVLEYTVSPNDVLGIFIWRHSDLSGDSTVRPDGKISLPLIGDVGAQGLTLTQLDTEITKKYSEYILSPDISLTVKKFAGDKVFVFGEVNHPGVYNFLGTTSLVNILGEAGGWTKDAKISTVLVIRGDITDEPEVIKIDVNELLRGNARLNVQLYPRDIIYVPSTVISDVRRFMSDYLGPINSLLTTIVTIDYFKKR